MKKKDIFILVLIITLSRLPFVFNGYGVEEDSWGLVLNAWEMKEEGRYIHSRLPGHPVQEAVYFLIYDSPPLVYNALSVFFGILAVVWFYLLLDHIRFRKPFIASLAFSFVPVFFLSTVSTIDYAWALAFVIGSLYMGVKGRFTLSGILLGLAFGTRITSILFLPPMIWLFLQIHGNKNLRFLFVFFAWFMLLAISSYLIPVSEYGFGIFRAYSLPFPGVARTFYKMTIGVFGFVGVMALLTLFLVRIFSRGVGNNFALSIREKHPWAFFSIMIILVHLLLFLIYPHKSAFLMPAVPFAIVLFSFLASGSQQPAILYTGLIVGSFLFGVDLSDPYRGSASSRMAIHKSVAGERVFLDPMRGPILHDFSRRKAKKRFTDQVIRQVGMIDKPTLIIAGWWYNQVLTELKRRDIQSEVLFLDHISEELLQNYNRYGFDLFYLPEIDRINDNRYGREFTALYARPLIPD